VAGDSLVDTATRLGCGSGSCATSVSAGASDRVPRPSLLCAVRPFEQSPSQSCAVSAPGLIFPGGKGQPMRPWTLTRKLERIMERAGLPHIRFHDLRHTCATLLLSKGVHPKFVQELLGHAARLLFIASIAFLRKAEARRSPSLPKPKEEDYGTAAAAAAAGDSGG
jgi:hypothetical protein